MPTGGGGGGGVSGFPVNLFQIGAMAVAPITAVANKVIYTGFQLSVPLTFANLVANVQTADGVNNSDIGIYAANGATLLANIGAQHLGSTGWQGFAIAQTSVTLNPGRYVFAMTSVGSTLSLNRDNAWPAWAVSSAGVGASVGGALPANIPAPTFAIGSSSSLMLALYT